MGGGGGSFRGVLVIRGKLQILGSFRVLVVRVDIGAQTISSGYRCMTYI